jgi:hypothetical protein
VDDELLARLAALVGVVLAGERERLQDAVAVDRLRDLVRVLGDDREQVGEQLPLDPRELRRRIRTLAPPVLGLVDRRVAGQGDVAVLGGQAAALRLGWVLRYDSPSSRRRR